MVKRLYLLAGWFLCPTWRTGGGGYGVECLDLATEAAAHAIQTQISGK